MGMGSPYGLRKLFEIILKFIALIQVVAGRYDQRLDILKNHIQQKNDDQQDRHPDVDFGSLREFIAADRAHFFTGIDLHGA